MAASFSPVEGNYVTIDTSGRFALDKLLREHGYVIADRPKKGEARWRSPKGEILLESRALKKLKKSDIEDAKYAQALYLEGKFR